MQPRDEFDALSTLLEESLAVPPQSEAKVLSALSRRIHSFPLRAVPTPNTRDTFWQHGLRIAVMFVLAVGLFALVARREHSTVTRQLVAEDGGEEKKAAPPKPDPKPDDAVPDVKSNSDSNDVKHEDRSQSWVESWKKHAGNEKLSNEQQIGAKIDPAVPAEKKQPSLDIELAEIDRVFPFVPSESKSMDGCEMNLTSFYSRNGRDGLEPKKHYVVVERAFDLMNIRSNNVSHTNSGIVVAFCRRGCHDGFRHVLMSNGLVHTVYDDKDLMKLFRSTAEKMHLDLKPVAETTDSTKLKAWVDALGSDDFSKREEAQAALSAAGYAAANELEAGAKSDDVERASRCKALLKAGKKEWDLLKELDLLH